MASSPPPQTLLEPIGGRARPASDWVTTFHLVVVALDPFTLESSWILPTAHRVLATFRGADCRVGWLVCTGASEAREFLGPLSEEFLTFTDPSREVVGALGIEMLPAIVHLNHHLEVVGSAEGWNPTEWRDVTDRLSRSMQWSRVIIPLTEDPGPFPGSPSGV